MPMRAEHVANSGASLLHVTADAVLIGGATVQVESFVRSGARPGIFIPAGGVEPATRIGQRIAQFHL